MVRRSSAENLNRVQLTAIILHASCVRFMAAVPIMQRGLVDYDSDPSTPSSPIAPVAASPPTTTAPLPTTHTELPPFSTSSQSSRPIRRPLGGICDVCASPSSVSRYRCPACDALYCTSACYTSHCTHRPCLGRRNPAAFVPMTDFNAATLASDLNFLTSILDATKRARSVTSSLRPARSVKRATREASAGVERGRGRAGVGRGRGGRRRTTPSSDPADDATSTGDAGPAAAATPAAAVVTPPPVPAATTPSTAPVVTTTATTPAAARSPPAPPSPAHGMYAAGGYYPPHPVPHPYGMMAPPAAWGMMMPAPHYHVAAGGIANFAATGSSASSGMHAHSGANAAAAAVMRAQMEAAARAVYRGGAQH